MYMKLREYTVAVGQHRLYQIILKKFEIQKIFFTGVNLPAPKPGWNQEGGYCKCDDLLPPYKTATPTLENQICK